MSKLSASVIPSLLVNDLEETLAFYERLGFVTTGRQQAGNGHWAEVRRDDVVLHFFTDPPIGIADIPTLSGTIYFHPDDVTSLAAEWKGKVEFAWGPEVMPYGNNEFGITDPNGYFLAFSEPGSKR
ncbi:MAG: hypothetical protein RIC14_06865 [Filomicrobium sp.]